MLFPLLLHFVCSCLGQSFFIVTVNNWLPGICLHQVARICAQPPRSEDSVQERCVTLSAQRSLCRSPTAACWKDCRLFLGQTLYCLRFTGADLSSPPGICGRTALARQPAGSWQATECVQPTLYSHTKVHILESSLLDLHMILPWKLLHGLHCSASCGHEAAFCACSALLRNSSNARAESDEAAAEEALLA